MPHIKLPNYRLGISPSVRSSYKMDNLNPSQKLDLVAARIFGISFGGNLRNGMKAIKRLDSGQNRARQYSVPVWNPAQWFPFMTQWKKLEFNRKLVDGRKMRIMMRGVKIGRQKGGEKISILNIYERKKASME
ncbi:unnamed protein product (macronuclear) [Paramecium tetraurelia]|uniref:Uncharacterized protein n=1 Tax=Paramecium tetraurelia TaxID=5888 RepID=A0CPL6_PARTE|nr:uncharacterized protein GSPATT00009125001 [Paramecium tetraurelia]CAK72733.1 unnamed protein product [Paramecium tetraurelia]|eukprot:XP_001440130.1 hypothetical protein (macronuclear) [Paramecium tetraurelia strain d4-2]